MANLTAIANELRFIVLLLFALPVNRRRTAGFGRRYLFGVVSLISDLGLFSHFVIGNLIPNYARVQFLIMKFL
jgi:hypothetical protein